MIHDHVDQRRWMAGGCELDRMPAMARGKFPTGVWVVAMVLAAVGRALGQDPPSQGLPDPDGDGHPMYTNAAARPASYFYWHGQPVAFCMADLDGDGDLDIATANDNVFKFGPFGVSALLNRGDGTFGDPTVILNVGDQPFSIVAGDVDGDGDQDLVTASFESNSVTVLINDGQAGFGAPNFFPVGLNPRCVRLGDFNNDGLPDLATLNSGSGDISILMNQGGGVFGPDERTFKGANFGWTNDESGPFMEIADLDLDGDADIVIPTGTTIRFAWNLGTGGGGAGFSYNFNDKLPAASGFVFSVRVGDMNNDALPDLVSVSPWDGVLGVHLSKGKPLGNGSAAMFNPGTPYPLWAPLLYMPETSSVALGDFNGDGWLDAAAVPSNWCGATFVLMNKGNGTLEVLPYRPNEEEQFQCEAGDLNGDGLDDLAILFHTTIPRLGIMLSLPEEPPASFDVNVDKNMAEPEMINPQAITTADVDHDGDLDAIVALTGAGPTKGGVSIGRAEGDVIQGDGELYEVSLDPERRVDLVLAADFSGDGWADLAVTHHDRKATQVEPGRVSILFNQGDGTFGGVLDLQLAIYPSALASADLDGDGDSDLAARGLPDFDPKSPPPTLDRVVQIVWNDGANRLRAGETYTINAKSMIDGNGVLGGLAAADLDGDGDPELIAAAGEYNVSYGELVVRFNDGGTFGRVARVTLPEQPASLACEDLDGDGDVDVAVLYCYTQPIWSPREFLVLETFLNDGTGALLPRRQYSSNHVSLNGSELQLSTPDASGVVLAYYLHSNSLVMVQRVDEGNPGLPPGPYGTGAGCLGLALREHDGRIDVLVTSVLARNVGILRDRRPQAPACPADCDGSGGLNIDDFICFQTFYVLNDPYADCDASGQLNIDDFICFQTLYVLGC